MQNRIKLEDRINKFISDVKTQFYRVVASYSSRKKVQCGEQSPFFSNQLLNFKIKC